MRTWYWVDYVILLYQSASFLNELLFSMVRCEVYNNNMLPLKVKAAAPTLIISTFTSLLSLAMSRRKRCRPIWTSSPPFSFRFWKIWKKKKATKTQARAYIPLLKCNNKESELKKSITTLNFSLLSSAMWKDAAFSIWISCLFLVIILLVKLSWWKIKNWSYKTRK